MINFENVSVLRENQAQLLTDIDWQIKKKENWAILGLNGSGKTTLLKLITGQIWPSSGKLTVLNQRFGQTSIPELQRRIGWVSSALQYQLKDHFIAEDIVLSGKFASIGIHQQTTITEQQQAKELLIQCGGAALLGKKYGILSQGQRQLLLIARALMTEPELLILDEPCNGLDLFARDDLLQRITAIADNPNGPALLFVTHYAEELLPCFSQLMLLRRGKIFAKGPTEQLLQADLLADFYEKPVELLQLSNKRLTVVPTYH